MSNRPLFSILHPSARPDQWRKVYDAWIAAAVHPEDVEYVLCVDERWGFKRQCLSAEFHACEMASREWWEVRERDGLNVEVWNESRRCYVDSVNTAARASTGSILIVIADDQYPCEKWDAALSEACLKGSNVPAFLAPDYVVSVSTGTTDEHKRRVMVMPILSRARYERLGYVFFPEYESMYADNDFAGHAEQDRCIVDARSLLFPHRHPLVDPSISWDDAYAQQNRGPAYELGKALLDRRRSAKFDGIAPVQTAQPSAQDSRSILVCLPGEQFSRHWVFAWTQVVMHLVARGFNVTPWFNYCSSAAITRGAFAQGVLSAQDVPDLVLWIDDDQVVLPHHVDRLIVALDAKPDADIMAGWTWIQDDGGQMTRVSCGALTPDGANVTHAPVEEMIRLQAAGAVAPVEWTGFPVVLMRGSTIEKASESARKRSLLLLKAMDALEGKPEGASQVHPSSNPFCPIMAPASQWGHGGEDISFCQNVTAAGGKVYVDATVFVEHLKLRCVAPPIPRPANETPTAAPRAVPEENKRGLLNRIVGAIVP